ncbi:RICIN domain-containing protein [Dactylosporangium sp. NPDC050588]|uniref:RICIN domain-containing protein n=1 Tax=Dactylosporangium sp. NPDC050588 TaxID=3157211 RepID=UPI0033C5B665
MTSPATASRTRSRTGRTIAATVNGTNPALFARTDATGKLELYTGDTATGTPAGTAAPVVYAASGFDADTVPAVTGADINTDGKPDLWADSRGTTLDARLNTGADALAAAVTNQLGNQGLLKPAYAGYCVDDKGSATTAGNPIQLYSCNGGPLSQWWTMTSDGALRLGTMCLDVTSSGTANNTLVQLYSCNKGPAQQWRIGPNFSLINPQSGKCLDVPVSATADGTRLQIYTCNGTDAQKWIVH